jgi:hypothetical protein
MLRLLNLPALAFAGASTVKLVVTVLVGSRNLQNFDAAWQLTCSELSSPFFGIGKPFYGYGTITGSENGQGFTADYLHCAGSHPHHQAMTSLWQKALKIETDSNGGRSMKGQITNPKVPAKFDKSTLSESINAL